MTCNVVLEVYSYTYRCCLRRFIDKRYTLRLNSLIRLIEIFLIVHELFWIK